MKAMWWILGGLGVVVGLVVRAACASWVGAVGFGVAAALVLWAFALGVDAWDKRRGGWSS